MNDLPQILLITAGLGWFSLTYALSLGKKGFVRTFVWTVFYWLILLDCLAIMGNMVWLAMRLHITSPLLLCSFVILPWALCGCRFYWVLRRSRRT